MNPRHWAGQSVMTLGNMAQTKLAHWMEGIVENARNVVLALYVKIFYSLSTQEPASSALALPRGHDEGVP
jgi:hypothetical protein